MSPRRSTPLSNITPDASDLASIASGTYQHDDGVTLFIAIRSSRTGQSGRSVAHDELLGRSAPYCSRHVGVQHVACLRVDFDTPMETTESTARAPCDGNLSDL